MRPNSHQILTDFQILSRDGIFKAIFKFTTNLASERIVKIG